MCICSVHVENVDVEGACGCVEHVDVDVEGAWIEWYALCVVKMKWFLYEMFQLHCFPEQQVRTQNI